MPRLDRLISTMDITGLQGVMASELRTSAKKLCFNSARSNILLRQIPDSSNTCGNHVMAIPETRLIASQFKRDENQQFYGPKTYLVVDAGTDNQSLLSDFRDYTYTHKGFRENIKPFSQILS